MIKVLEYDDRTKKVREISLNPDHIVSVRWSDLKLTSSLRSATNTLGDNATGIIEFVFSNGKTILGIGHPDLITEKIRTSKKLLLG
jgi:hypothetical protein